SNLTKVKIQKCSNGVIIDGIPYTFQRKGTPSDVVAESLQTSPACPRIAVAQDAFKACVAEWEQLVASNWTDCDNIFLLTADLALVNKMLKEVGELMKTTEVKLNNAVMMMK
ncbi:MAG: hypothetical protein K2I90_08750, partial [Odoribacter sp.]|nr:hypothetical protein [Odoribacter sp.]